MDKAEIEHKIEQLVTEKIEKSQPVVVSWITQQIMSAYPGISGRDAELYRHVAREVISMWVKESINKYNGIEAPEEEAVDIEHLSAEELDALSERFSTHSAELRAYLKERKGEPNKSSTLLNTV